MSKEKTREDEDYSRMVNGNTILLSLEGWIKFVEGFSKGLQTTDKVSSSAVLDCIGEIMEYMTAFRKQLVDLFLHCEKVLEENETLKEQIYQLQNTKLLVEDISYVDAENLEESEEAYE